MTEQPPDTTAAPPIDAPGLEWPPEPPDGPPVELLFRRRVNLFAAVRELWEGRQIVVTLAERDLRVRYKQALLGAAWAVITPVMLMIVFNLFFRRVAKVETGNVPYALFTYVGLLPWTFFSSAVGSASSSLVGNSSLLNKLYCPREVFPLAAVGTSAVDTFVSTSVLGVLFVAYGFAPRGEVIWAPFLVMVGLAYTVGLSLLLAALMVYIRDLRSTIPMFLQLGLFATPVGWQIDKIPANLRGVYSFLNPLAAVIDGLRGGVLYGQPPASNLLVPATISSVLILFAGYLVFKKLETNFADVA